MKKSQVKVFMSLGFNHLIYKAVHNPYKFLIGSVCNLAQICGGKKLQKVHTENAQMPLWIVINNKKLDINKLI